MQAETARHWRTIITLSGGAFSGAMESRDRQDVGDGMGWDRRTRQVLFYIGDENFSKNPEQEPEIQTYFSSVLLI